MKVLITDKKNVEHSIDYAVGDSLAETIMYSAIGVDIQPFAICAFDCRCRTCHVVIEEKYFESLPSIEEDEEYLLNTSLNRENNSRLCCQIKMTEEMDGMKIIIKEDY